MALNPQPFLIAEIGINHNGDIELARQMITASADAGFDAVKFQKRTVDLVYTAEYLAGERDSPWGTTQREQKEGLEFGREESDEIDNLCRSLGLQWTASCWDMESLEFLKAYNPPFHKIASPMLGHMPLVRAAAADGRKTYISTGMSTLDEIDVVVKIFRAAGCPFELMHCNSTDPMLVADANCRRCGVLARTCCTTFPNRWRGEIFELDARIFNLDAIEGFWGSVGVVTGNTMV